MTPRALIAAALILVWAAPAKAQQSPPADVLWHRALVLLAQDDEGADEALSRACEAGSLPACLRGADRALAADDLDTALDLLQQAHDIDPEDQQIRLGVARLMAAIGNYLWAIRELRALEQEGVPVGFELGYCLYQLEQYDEAVERLTVAARSDDDQAQTAALYAAAALESLERFDEARAMAELAAGATGDPDVADAGRALIDALRRATSDRVAISVFGSLAAGYDSNPVFAPNETPLEVDALRLWLRAGLLTEPLGRDWWVLGGQLSFAREQTLTSGFGALPFPVDLTSLRAQLYARFNFDVGVVPSELRISYRYAIRILDGGDPLPEEDIYVYSEAHTGNLSFSLALTPRFITRLRVESGWNAYHLRTRTGAPLDVAVGQNVFLLDGQLKIYGEAGLSFDFTRGERYDRQGLIMSLAGSYLTPLWDIELILSWGYRWSIYPESFGDAAFDKLRYDIRRIDSRHSLSVELGREFLERHLRVTLRYRFTDAESTIRSYDYSRHILSLEVTGGF